MELELKALKRRQKQERIRRRREQFDTSRCSERRQNNLPPRPNNLPPRPNNNNATKIKSTSTSTPTPTPTSTLPLTNSVACASKRSDEKLIADAKVKSNEIDAGKEDGRDEDSKTAISAAALVSESRRNRLQRERKKRLQKLKEEKSLLRGSQLIQEHYGEKHFEDLCGGSGGSVGSDSFDRKNTATSRLLSQQSEGSSGGISPLTQSPSITIKTSYTNGNNSNNDSTPELSERNDQHSDGWYKPHSTTTNRNTNKNRNRNRKTTKMADTMPATVKRCNIKNRASLKSTSASLGGRRSQQQTGTNVASWDIRLQTNYQFHDGDGDGNGDGDGDGDVDDRGLNKSSISLELGASFQKETKDRQGDESITKPRVLFEELPATIDGGGGNNGSDSSSEEDLFAARAYIDLQKVKKSNNGSIGDGGGKSANHQNKKRDSSSPITTTTSRWHVGRNKLGTQSQKNDGNVRGGSSSSEEEDLFSSARKIRASQQRQVDSSAPLPPSRPLASHGNDDGDWRKGADLRRSRQRPQKKEDGTASPFKTSSPPLEMKAVATVTDYKNKRGKGDEDDLWGDDNDLEVDKAGDDAGSIGNGTRDRQRRRQSRSQRASDPNDDRNLLAQQCNSSHRILEEEDEDLEERLKPEFEDPKLGPPSTLEPLVLVRPSPSSSSSSLPLSSWLPNKHKDVDAISTATSSTSEVVPDQVPASVNRYLQDYQREGVDFLYLNVMRNMGAILGDDMGLGKTVQLIALLAALQKKTGTEKDLKFIHQRAVYLEQKAIERRNESDLAMLKGTTNIPKQSSTTAEIKERARWKGESGDFSPCLIIVPPSVIDNWSNEFNAWGHFAVSIFQDKEKRAFSLEQASSGMSDVMICGRALFSRPESFASISSVEWKMIVVDELHEYNKSTTQSYKCLLDLRLKCCCPLIGMTGTLMSNNHKELWTLVDLVQPNHLGPWKTFRKHFSDPIKRARAKEAKDDCVKLASKRTEELDAIMKKVYLKRNKSDVLKDTLTTKDEKVVFCCLSDVQKRMYQRILSLPDYESLQMSNTPCDCGVNKEFFRGYMKLESSKERVDYQRRHKDKIVKRKKCCYNLPYDPERGSPIIDPQAVLWKAHHRNDVPCEKCPSCTFLPAIQKLYKVCSHPSLLQLDNAMDLDKESCSALDFAKVALTPDILQDLPGKTYVRGDSIMDDHIALSGKMKALDYCLKTYQQQGDRVLVFSYSTRTLDMIQHYIRGKGWSFLRLDGSTPTKKRQPLIDQFQRDPSIFVFLISTRAGGIGLNLTAANRVIVFDVNWNPSHDEQAQDRAFRIGQLRDVDVVRLVARGTIEELMYARQIYKVHLKKQTLEGSEDKNAPARIFRGVHKDPNRKGELFGVENLLRYKDGSFMMDLWKKSDECGDNGETLQQMHRVSDVVSKISTKKAQEQLEFGKDQEILSMTTSGGITAKNTTKPIFNINKVNHEDFLREDRGDAAVRFGDEGYSEEMGGGSQAMHDVIVKKSTELVHPIRGSSCSTICEVDEEEIPGDESVAKEDVTEMKRNQQLPLPLKSGCQILDSSSPPIKKKRGSSTIVEMVNDDYEVMRKNPEKMIAPEKSQFFRKTERESHAVFQLGKSMNAKENVGIAMRKESTKESTVATKCTPGTKRISIAESITFDVKKEKFSTVRHLYTPTYLK